MTTLTEYADKWRADTDDPVVVYYGRHLGPVLEALGGVRLADLDWQVRDRALQLADLELVLDQAVEDGVIDTD